MTDARPVLVRLEEMSRGDVEASLRAVLLLIKPEILDGVGPHIRDHIEQVAGLAALVRQVLAAQPDERDYGDADTLALSCAPLADGKVRVTSRRFGEDSVIVLPHQELVVRASAQRRGQVNVARRNVRPRMPQDAVQVGNTTAVVSASVLRVERDLARAALEVIRGWMLATGAPAHTVRLADAGLAGEKPPEATGYEMAAPRITNPHPPLGRGIPFPPPPIDWIKEPTDAQPGSAPEGSPDAAPAMDGDGPASS